MSDLVTTEEIEALHTEVVDMQQKFERLQEDHDRSLHELESSQRNDSQLLRTTSESLECRLSFW